MVTGGQYNFLENYENLHVCVQNTDSNLLVLRKLFSQSHFHDNFKLP